METVSKEGTIQCRYVRAGVRCERRSLRGWTMCPGHYTAGMGLRQAAQIGIVLAPANGKVPAFSPKVSR